MNLLVIGSGGREHALIWAISKSPLCKKIYAMPGNGGTDKLAENISIAVTDHDKVVHFCREKNIDLVMIGPETPLVDGLADTLEKHKIPVVGPSKLAAQLEGSKEFTKKLCDRYNIPTAAYEAFTDATLAKKYIEKTGTPIVIKADGLAAGKGVIIAHTKEEAFIAIDDILVKQKFGAAGNSLVIEEFLVGEEISVFALVDGNDAIYFGSAQDHKTVGDGDTGLNTGGMGTYSPAPIMTIPLEKEIMETIILPSMAGMKKDGNPFKGVLFAGLMITKNGPKLIEYNVRFGDPETQSLMARLDSDIVELLIATANGKLKGLNVKFKPDAALCVVMAANGYPEAYKTGSVIKNIDAAEKLQNVIVFHAGTKKDNNGVITAHGGRVLGVTALGKNVTEAQRNAYSAVDNIEWNDGFCRRDIGWRAVAREKA